ncbi:glycosyltransferase family 2 protein [Fodinisporobacter ferrooxydans]|uniref:Glucosyl-3-phosphoglycerate synthase n=1 Tax=Fodinisporobacter ferrooxydans TaxID=2901836 RepID=A0ABY4CKF3_9BACL|nr:glycosyltransferase family 2 protein [Alicyclobacillaceae bacterium MYW30-H2]
MTLRVSAIIPAYNEADQITDTIRGLQNMPEIAEIWVVDDGSRDQTADLAKHAGASVLRFSKNMGKAAAAWAGIRQAKEEWLLFCDADLGASVQGIHPLFAPLERGEADMTIGVLPTICSKQGFGITKGIARAGIHHCTTYTCMAPLSGQRVLRREMFTQIESLARGYGMEVGLTIDALRLGCRMSEVPIDVSHRLYGRTWNGAIHRGKQLLDVLQALHSRYLEV